ncbi:MAG: EAL domain-containing protein, partial [Henriciella sp.]|uniref:putative bifunctional diguanylate cyclase/phosphodiesterase n=1 Tax=Henriciella sp. TaxID=1968823 RepID=UPI003C726E60
LELHYQPFVDTAEIRVTGAEALLRWNHPEWGVISPSEFVPILEASGQMQEVGRWVLNTACRQLREWRELGNSDFKMAVNLSARQLQDPELKNIIERTVQNHGLSPASIELELTETAAMEDSALTLRLFRSLREAGYSLSIDDFGSGYSSMSYLKNLPFSKLKIDREFVSHVDQSLESSAICKALVELASGLGISALAEGVERREEVDALMQMGCTRFQGFYFAAPMRADAFANKISETDWLAALCSPAVRLQDELKRHYS